MEETETVIEAPTTESREQIFASLYEATFPVVARFVQKMGGTFADAKDIFQDSLIIYFEKQRAGILPATAVQEAYLLGIAKHLWLRKYYQDKGKISFEDLGKDLSVPEDYFAETDNRLLALLQVTGRKCLELLQAFYYEQLDLSTIAATFGFRNVHSASVQKYKCLEKVRETAKEKSLTYEELSN